MFVKQLVTMSDYPSPDIADVQLVDVLRAVADPIRLQIVRVLADGRPHPKTMTEWGVDVQKSTMAHDLKTLREADVCPTIVSGRTHEIQLRRDELDQRFPGLIEALLRG